MEIVLWVLIGGLGGFYAMRRLSGEIIGNDCTAFLEGSVFRIYLMED